MSTRDIDVIKQTILQNKIVSSDTISQFMEKCNNNFSAIIEFGGGPVGEKGEKGEDGVPTKPKVPIHVWKKGVDYEKEEMLGIDGYKIYNINDLSDPKYQDGHLIFLENAHVYILELELDNTDFKLKPKFLTIFNTYDPYNDLDKNKAYVHIAYADGYYDRENPEANPDGFITSNNLSANDEDPLNKKYIGVYTDETADPSNQAYAYKWSKIKGDKGDKGDPGDPVTLIEKTYSELFELRKNSELIPGLEYRITDYVTTCNQSGSTTGVITSSAEHQFDIIVTADTENTLNADARVCLHVFEDTTNEDSEYFLNNKLSEWKIKYDINNDTDKYKWSVENGKGVIYWMQDEFGNEACYDFKNILFNGKFTFNSTNGQDYSLYGTSCYENKIKGYYSGLKLILNNIIFLNCRRSCNNNTFDINCYNITFKEYQRQHNTFGINCHDNTFESGCLNNTFGNNCSNNEFKDDCSNNTFGNNCLINKFGGICQSNTFGNTYFDNEFEGTCYYNTFGDGCSNNIFGDNCSYNTFGDGCQDNRFGTNCTNNTFGNYCQYNIFGNYYKNIKFDNNCSYIDITIGDNSNLYVQNYIFESVSTGTSSDKKNYEVTRNNQYTTKVSKTSDGTVRIYCEEDIQTNIDYSNLVTLRDTGKLIPGMQYRITDFVTKTTTTITNAMSAEHPFDVIVTASSNKTFNENAKAALHYNDTYFANCNIDSWELKYCIDNDTDRFEWVDETNGTGVIYYMKDNGGNEACYDFKNIMFRNPRNKNDTKWYYTFTNANHGDLSLSVDVCYENKIGGYYNGLQLKLNNILFDCSSNSSMYNNVFGCNCYDNVLVYGCYNNTFGNGCYKNKLNNGCYNNTFGNGCYNNIIGFESNNNKFGNDCCDNSFGYKCYNNTFGNSCVNNDFGDNCLYNTCGNICQHIDFGNYCINNTFGNYCFAIKFLTISGNLSNYFKNIRFENGCENMKIIEDKSYAEVSAYAQNYVFMNTVSGKTGNPQTHTINRGNAYSTKVSKASDGTVRIYCEEDIQTNIDYSNLVTLRDTGKLIPGMQYRITDFVTTCNNQGAYNQRVKTSSANHRFDIIVTADTANTLNADARVCLNDGDKYFLNNKLSDWKIKYDINNDTTKYKWVDDSENGRGVIYWMQDEFGNEACYDFKNILFDGFYTFDLCVDGITHTDFSLLGDYCFENKIKGYYDSRLLIQCLNNNLCLSKNNTLIALNILGTNTQTCIINTNSRNNHIGDYCNDIILGSGCNNITLGNDCNFITLGDNCYNNTFGNVCYNIRLVSNCCDNTLCNGCNEITLGNGCNNNILGNGCGFFRLDANCLSNTFGNMCNNIRLGSSCYNNTFGNMCNNIQLGNEYYSNTFENECGYIIFGNGNNDPNIKCRYNYFGFGCMYIQIMCKDTSTTYVQNYTISKFIQGTNKENIFIYTEKNKPNIITVAKNSSNTIVQYCEADLYQQINDIINNKEEN